MVNGAKKPGIVYAITNDGLPELIKIGMVESTDPRAIRARLGHLKAGNPHPYRVAGAARSLDAKTAEHDLHVMLKATRESYPGGGTEWFRVEPESILLLMGSMQNLKPIPPEELKAALRSGMNTKPHTRLAAHIGAGQTKKVKSLDSLGIHLDDVLESPGVGKVCRVVKLAPPRVELDGRTMSLTGAAKVVAGYHVSGLQYWRHRGVRLCDIHPL